MPTTARAFRRPARAVLGSGIAAFALVLTGCSGDSDDPIAETTESGTPTASQTPILTAPPTKTPEEEAKAEIIATFESLIEDRDEYYSNTSDYDPAEIETNPPALEWNVTFQAEGELSNWTVGWRRSGEVEQVGESVIATHNVSNVKLRDSGLHDAQSTACLDMRELEFVNYDGKPAELSYEPDPYQTWTMTWIHYRTASPDSGIDEPGWYIRTLDLTRNEPC